jgi:ribonuclease HI
MKNKILNVYSDGGSRGNPGESAGGFLFELEGEVILERGLYLGITTNNLAEYLAFINACQELIKIKKKIFQKVIFHLDSMLVVKQMNKEWKIKDEKIKEISRGAFKILDSLNVEYEIIHVYREKNTKADFLVNEVLDFLK